MKGTAAATAACLLATLASSSIGARADEEKVPLKDVPKAVIDAVKARFPKAEIESASKEVEDGETIYEIETEVDDRDVDLTLKSDGAVLEIEKEIDVKSLPRAVAEAVAAKHPKAKIKEAEEVVEFEDGKEEKSFEVAIDEGGKELELKVAPDGKILKTKVEEDDENDEKDKD